MRSKISHSPSHFLGYLAVPQLFFSPHSQMDKADDTKVDPYDIMDERAGHLMLRERYRKAELYRKADYILKGRAEWGDLFGEIAAAAAPKEQWFRRVGKFFKMIKRYDFEEPTMGELSKRINIASESSCRHPPNIFSYEQLEEATNGFSKQIGDGGFSNVFQGMLDGKMVAVKKLKDGREWRKDFKIEAGILCSIDDKNVVAFYGCTDPRTENLMLVYEFLANGTLCDHLHVKKTSLPWALRLQIAIETAKGLTCLHSLKRPIIHRDVKTQNILLDNDFHARVGDLGLCRPVPVDTKCASTRNKGKYGYLDPWDIKCMATKPQGTYGYFDPGYEKSHRLTDKVDVYSFGVVLLELISRQQALDVDQDEWFLFNRALDMILKKKLGQLVDPALEYGCNGENDRMILEVAELACVCLQEDKLRPPMVEVLSTLKMISGRTENMPEFKEPETDEVDASSSS